MSWGQRIATIAKVLAIFVALGPPIGALVLFMGMGLYVWMQSGDVAGLVWVPLLGIIYAVPLSYLIGAIPAGIAGLIVGVAAAFSYRPGMLFATATGLAVGLGLVYAGGRPIFSTTLHNPSENVSAVLIVGTCLAATLACWAVARAVATWPGAAPRTLRNAASDRDPR
jgi:hypothetical protein